MSPFVFYSALTAPNKDEESVAIEEVKAIGEAVQEIESSIQSTDVDAALNTYSFSGEPFR